MAIDTSCFPWKPQTLTRPEMAKVRLQSINCPYSATFSPPLTPPAELVGCNSSRGSSRRSSEDYVSAETLMSMASSAFALVDFGSSTGFDSRRGSTSSSVGFNSSTERLPSFSEVVKGVPLVYNQWRTDPNTVGLAVQTLPGNYGHGGLLTPIPSPTCSSNGSYWSPDLEHSVPWSRSQIPSNYASHPWHDRVIPCNSVSKHSCGSRAKHTRQEVSFAPERHRHKYYRVKKTKRDNKPAKSGCKSAESDDELAELYVLVDKPAESGDELAESYVLVNHPKTKRVNKTYSPTQHAFIIYHKVDLGLKWAEVQDQYLRWFPDDPERTEGGVQCMFYRTNGSIPQQTEDKLLVLRYDYDEVGDMDGGNSEQGEEEEDDEVKYKHSTYKVHGLGSVPVVELKKAEIKVRERDVSLLERFPEVLADETNEWVKPEHREMARELAERRLRQRQQWREWMQQTHPKKLHLVDNPPPKGAGSKRKTRGCKK